MKGLILVLLLLLSGCDFNGIRTSQYDGEDITINEEANAVYAQTGEIIGPQKDYYFRYEFSEDVTEKSLIYPDQEPVLLTEETYVIGENIPSGRATLFSNDSSFDQYNYDVAVGNLVITDSQGQVYFENMFHPQYGSLTAQVDLIDGHTITIKGEKPEITVYYSVNLPEDPYALMEPPELLANMEALNPIQPIINTENSVTLTAGIYEVGTDIEEGNYTITHIDAAATTELYLFNENTTPRVFVLTPGSSEQTIELKQGDKIYPHLVKQMELTKN